MNPSTALARVLVDELVRNGVREAVLSPGSRSAPLAYALHQADAAGRLRLHVRVDERTAGFLALGLAKAGGGPVPVVTTSGTAAANLHPAVLEASHAGVPLLALTADRPPELRGTGANQTVDQVKLYGDAVRFFAEVPAPERRAGQNAPWRSLVCRALGAARGALDADPGPAHLNVPLREPLVPEDGGDWVEPLDGRPDGASWTGAWAGLPLSGTPYPGAPRTLVVAGDAPEHLGFAAARLASSRGWPLIAEPVAGALPGALPGLLLSVPGFLEAHLPEQVLVVGRPTLSRAVQALLRDPRVTVDVASPSPRWADPAAAARSVVPASALSALRPETSDASWTMSWGPGPAQGDPGFLAAWRRAGAAAAGAREAFLDAEPALSGPHVARTLLRALPDPAPHADWTPLLVLGSSSVVRDVELVGTDGARVRLLANRGAAGIDGTVSTSVGAALAAQRHLRTGGGVRVPAYALMGDLTFLHDATGLVIGPDEPRPDLTIVVVNDDGGAIFGLLEQGAPEHAPAFERVFATPTGVELAALCAATATPHVLVRDEEELREALAPASGIRVVEVRTERRAARDLHERLRSAVGTAVRAALPG